MREFKTFHPIVNFIYFAFVIGFSMFMMHPLCLGISLVCAFVYAAMLKGRASIGKTLALMAVVFLLMPLFNAAFNHAGVTILAYLPNQNPLTLESVLYGFAAATMLLAVLLHFSCFNEIMTGDKLMYLFGKILPALSLVFSMTLRFVPKLTAQTKSVIRAQKCIGRDPGRGNLVQRARNGLAVLSVMVTWALEDSIETADSMKARGYGLPGRSAFTIYRFDKRDTVALVSIVLLGVCILVGAGMGGMQCTYFPAIRTCAPDVYNIALFTAYLLLCSMPIIIELLEVRKWKAISSKMCTLRTPTATKKR